MKQKISTAQQDANAKLKLLETFGDTSFDHHYFAEICDNPLTGAFKKKTVVHAGLGGTPVPQEKTAEVWQTLLKTQRRAKTSAYIHIPFCRTHCLYCGFFANFAQQDKMQAYTKALVRELEADQDSDLVQSHPVNAVYFLQLAPQQQAFLLVHAVHAAVFHHRRQLLQPGNGLLDGLEVGEHAAEPAPVHVGHAAALRRLAHRVLGRALGADEQDRAVVRSHAAAEVHGIEVQGKGLLEIDDVDPVAVAEDEGRHLGIPEPGLVAEVHAGLQHVTHRHCCHRIRPRGSG